MWPSVAFSQFLMVGGLGTWLSGLGCDFLGRAELEFHVCHFFVDSQLMGADGWELA